MRSEHQCVRSTSNDEKPKDGFVALSVSGAVVLFFAGMLLGWNLAHPDVGGFLMTLLSLAVVRDDACGALGPGTYRLGWFVRRRVAP